MQKGLFKVCRTDGAVQVEGEVDRFFGLCKYSDDANSWFAVTHRPTGKLLASFSKKKQALSFVSHLHNAPHGWQEESDAFKNYAFVLKIARDARSGLEPAEQARQPGLFG